MAELTDRDARRLLGISSDATAEEIDTAWHRARRAHHPDRIPDRSEKTQSDAHEKYVELERCYQRLRKIAMGGRGAERPPGDPQPRPTASQQPRQSAPEPKPNPSFDDFVRALDGQDWGSPGLGPLPATPAARPRSHAHGAAAVAIATAAAVAAAIVLLFPLSPVDASQPAPSTQSSSPTPEGPARSVVVESPVDYDVLGADGKTAQTGGILAKACEDGGSCWSWKIKAASGCSRPIVEIGYSASADTAKDPETVFTRRRIEALKTDETRLIQKVATSALPRYAVLKRIRCLAG